VDRDLFNMENDPSDQIPKAGGEPSPLIMIGVAVIPLLAVAGWFFGLFG
jgi:hypothetical protein